MADWYISSIAYAALPTWAATTAYTVGQIIRPLTPSTVAGTQLYTFRCTTAGTSGGSEPAWNDARTNNSSLVSGTATFTNVAGQSAYGWGAAAGSMYCMSDFMFARPSPGDRVFVSSDSVDNIAGATALYFSSTQTVDTIAVISVNKAGSVPPVAADILAGAQFNTTSGDLRLEPYTNTFYQGIIFSMTAGSLTFNANAIRMLYFKDCKFVLAGASAGYRLKSDNVCQTVWDNTQVQFGHVGQAIQMGTMLWDLRWINTATPLAGAIFPTTLVFQTGHGALATFKGLDLTSLGSGTLTQYNTGPGGPMKMLLDSCKLSNSTIRYTGTTGGGAMDEVELVNCYNGTNPINERATADGNLTTERTIVLTGGATDTAGAFSHKMVSNTRPRPYGEALASFFLDLDNSTIGSSMTATVQVISSASLNNNDLTMEVEYMGTLGTTVTSVVNSWTTSLTPTAALPTSVTPWTSSPPTPVSQYLQVTFTPRVSGKVRARLYLRKASTTVYIDPRLVLA